MLGPFSDLRSFIGILDCLGELRRIQTNANPRLEIAAITQRVGRSGDGGAALIFESPLGYSWRVATNLFGSPMRAALAWGGADIDSQALRLREGLAAVGSGSAEQRLAQVLEQADCAAMLDGKPQWELSAATLANLPALRSWPAEAGSYLTLPVVVSCHPLTGELNYGLYRLQLLGPQRAAIHWNAGAGAAQHQRAWGALGKAMPVAVVLGGPPALLAAACMPLPAEVNEATFAAYLTGAALECTPGPLTGLPLPVSAEIVLEGSISADEFALEGPFGNHSGRYVEASLQSVFQLQALYHRPEPILPATVVGPPPMENCYLAQVNSQLLLPLWACDHPTLLDAHFPLEGVFHGAALLSVAEGAGAELIPSLWGINAFRRSRLLIACPPTVNIRRPEQVYWHVLNGIDPGRDLLVNEGRIGIDASRLRPGSPVVADAATAALVESRWKEYFPDAN